MNAPFLICMVLAVGFGIYALYALHLDRLDDDAEYHLMHGPNDGCVECEDK